MNLPKIQNGRLQILNQRGAFIRSYATPNVVFADIKPNDSFILVTYESGKVELLNEHCVFVKTIASANAVNARFIGNEIVIQNKDGKTEIRNERGIFIRKI